MNKKIETDKGHIQEEEYIFPYHYIPRFESGVFTQTMNINWGFEYLSSLEFLLGLLNNIPFKSLIDVGCGDGRFCSEAAKRFPGRRICGVDVSERAISLARALNPEVEFLAGDITNSAFKKMESLKGGFDLAVSIEVLEHIKPAEASRFMEKTALLLKPGGRLILTAPTLNTPLQAKHYRHFDFDSLDKLLKPNFNIEQFYYLNRISHGTDLLRKALSNRLFIINNRRLRGWIYKYYFKKYLIADITTGRRIIISAVKV
jgi:cyclopropane fatty-acyl-phospholipid synthase-like methyltransferase